MTTRCHSLTEPGNHGQREQGMIRRVPSPAPGVRSGQIPWARAAGVEPVELSRIDNRLSPVLTSAWLLKGSAKAGRRRHLLNSLSPTRDISKLRTRPGNCRRVPVASQGRGLSMELLLVGLQHWLKNASRIGTQPWVWAISLMQSSGMAPGLKNLPSSPRSSGMPWAR
jgi:hypothetical protein